MVLTLFFTRGVSLELWLNRGLFDREKLIYEEHLKQGNLKKVYWITYGSNDLKLSNQLKKDKRLNPNIVVVGMPKLFNLPKIGSYLYSLLIPFLYPKIFRHTDIFKSNQMDGAWSGVIAKKLYNVPFINRTGYTLSLFCKRKNKPKLKQLIIEKIESIIFDMADVSFVSSSQDKHYLNGKYNFNKSTLSVFRNYIDVGLFHPLNTKRNNKIVFVGRLDKQKNLFNLIESISNTDLELDVYGQGELEQELIKFTKSINAKIKFQGVADNKKLPDILNQYKYYILSSYYEGMPKTLLEAMACGCICIGTDVPGINEIIRDGDNGILAKNLTSESISKALKRAINTDNKEVLIKNGVSMVNERYALKVIAQKEFLIFRELVNDR